jgi:hypothetical protein
LNLKANEIDSVRALAKVNFSESSPQKKPCPIYRLSSQWRTRDYQLFYELCEIEEKAELISVIQIGKTCDCPQ